MLRFTFSLLAIIFVGAVCGRYQTEPEAEGCDYNMMFLEVGDSVYEGCEKCKCTKSGLLFSLSKPSLCLSGPVKQSTSWLFCHLLYCIMTSSMYIVISGLMKCTENTACCLYTDKKGRTKRAYPGDSFNDGCNQCRCGADGMAACTKMACPDKCSFKNWDLVSGYAKKGRVFAFDEKKSCPKECKCKVKKGKAKLKCRSPCVVF